MARACGELARTKADLVSLFDVVAVDTLVQAVEMACAFALYEPQQVGFDIGYTYSTVQFLSRYIQEKRIREAACDEFSEDAPPQAMVPVAIVPIPAYQSSL